MKIAALLFLSAATLAAQTAPKPAATHTAAAHHTAAARGGCIPVPQLSPKIPALPAGSSCPHALYTITATPPAHLDYVSPLEGTHLAEDLGLTSSSFTLAYVDTKLGSGPLAQPHKWYTIHYTGYLPDGTKFDSSLDRNEPITLQIGEHQVIRGWDTGFVGMHLGGKRRLFIPSQLAYGAQGRPGIPANSELVFDVELLAQSDTEPKKPEPPATPAPPTTPAAVPPSGAQTAPPAGTPPAQPATPPATSTPKPQ